VKEPTRVGRRTFLSGSVAQLAAAATTDTGSIHISRDLYPQQDLVTKRRERVRRQMREQKDVRPLTVAVFQMWNRCDGLKGKEDNLKRMLAAISTAEREGVQMLVFPEMCLSGYFTNLEGTPAEAVKANHALADEAGKGRFLTALQESAAKAKMMVSFGFGEKAGDRYYDSVGVIDATGEWLGVRRKNPLYPMDHETQSFTEPPRSQRSVVLQTRYAKVGISCCFDGEFPESVRQMRLQGAEVLLWSNAALGDPTMGTSHRLNLAGTHAETNRMWVVCCNASGRNCSGTSVISSPSGEPMVILSPDKEEMGIAGIDLTMSEDWSKWRDRLAVS
jgi:predicted amidohydrolase